MVETDQATAVSTGLKGAVRGDDDDGDYSGGQGPIRGGQGGAVAGQGGTTPGQGAIQGGQEGPAVGRGGAPVGGQGGQRICKTESEKYKGICFSNLNCQIICQTEGFQSGKCSAFYGKCRCSKPC